MGLRIKDEKHRERVYALIRGHVNTHVVEGNEEGVIIDGYISFDTMSEIVSLLSTSDTKRELFEECWVAYCRKGVKKNALYQWNRLKDSEKDAVLPHVKAYVASRERQYMKDFERYLRDRVFNEVVFSGNSIVYDPSKKNDGEYSPQGRTIWFNKETGSYWSTDSFYYGTVEDGYTDDDRPDGATLTLNNARGKIVWDASDRKWRKICTI